MRERGEVRVGDCIEFKDTPASTGIITNMIDKLGIDRPYILEDEQNEVLRIVVHRASDGKFEVLDPKNMPSAFCITFKQRYLV